MPEYIYTARTEDGKLKKDRIQMKDEKGLADYLKNKGLILTTSKIINKDEKFSIQKYLDKMSRVPSVEKIFFTQNLSIMVKTGFSLAQALNTLAIQTTNKKFQNIIKSIQYDIESGISFSNSLAKHPTIFPQIFVNMIAAGEVSGKLDEILINLTKQMKKDHALIAKVRTALAYPAVVVFAMIAIGVIMMITVVPQLVGIFEEAETELPITTKFLIGFSNLLQNQGVYLLLALIILVVVFFRLKKLPKFQQQLHNLILNLPMISSVIKKINIARFTRTLSSLLKTDIPIVQTLQIIAKTLGNVNYRNIMNEASEKVKKGISISKTLEDKPKLFPPIVTQMVNIGEESGTLDSISEEIAQFYEEDVTQTMDGLSSIIEPILMVVIGGVVAFLALSILQPMYGLVETI